MTELRTRMIRDMALRGFSPRTHETYIAAVVRLAKYYKRAPDQLSNDEVQAYLAHLIQVRKLSWSTCSQAAHAFRFLYHVTLGHPPTAFHVPAPKQPQKLPEILSREDVWRLLNACPHPRHRLLLATTYAAGLRVSEVVAKSGGPGKPTGRSMTRTMQRRKRITPSGIAGRDGCRGWRLGRSTRKPGIAAPVQRDGTADPPA